MSLDENLDDKIKSLEVAESFRGLSLQELREQNASLTSKISHISNKIGDLAFTNYRTYALAGRIAEDSIEMFADINKEMTDVKQRFPTLLEDLEKFDAYADNLFREYMRVDDAASDTSSVWELLSLVKMMDDCIKAGQYDSAYALTTFASNLQQSKLNDNPIVKKIVDKLIEARHGLLDVLFNKFAGPIDLAKSIQIVNNIRKIPYISNTQLRVSLLQYRDIYLEKNVMAIMSEPDYAVKIVDTYRDCMYDTIVLYLAVFPEIESQKRYGSADDPRWERWASGSQGHLLQSWAHRNLDVMFERIRSSEQRSPLDLETINGKLMSFAYSFGRMGMDFRPLIVSEIAQITFESFSNRIAKVTDVFVEAKQLNLLDNEIFENSKTDIERKSRADELSSTLSAPVELCIWDELCVFGNGIIDALNDLRHFVSPVFLNDIFHVLKSSFDAVLEWLGKFDSGADAEAAKRARFLMANYFLPFMNRCFYAVFSYDLCVKPHFKTSLSYDQYLDHYNFIPAELQNLREEAAAEVETINEDTAAEEQSNVNVVESTA